jgi:hypothetical protein
MGLAKISDRQYQICCRCIMDTTDPNIGFDDQGCCDYCNNFDCLIKPNWNTASVGGRQLAQMGDAIRLAGKGKDFDCIIGLSGGLGQFLRCLCGQGEDGLAPTAVPC